eukprot:11189062-Lingulodinium_polyedra.AAC.1
MLHPAQVAWIRPWPGVDFGCVVPGIPRELASVARAHDAPQRAELGDGSCFEAELLQRGGQGIHALLHH